MALSTWLPLYQSRIDQAIYHFFDTRYHAGESVERTFEAAIRYGVEGGGKRLRPILAMLAYEVSTGQEVGDALLTSLLGIEYIHCYTLIHDDLPCIDNDEYRRGRYTTWKQYGEPMALLIGDTLQTLGFEMLAASGSIQVITEIARALGDMGVARGQVRDTFLLHDRISLDELFRIHDEKTGIFIAASLVIGSILAQADDREIDRFRQFGILLGRAFQIRDDILDYEGESILLGKKTQKDIEQSKGIISLIGIDESKKILSDIQRTLLDIAGGWEDPRFRDIVDYVVSRNT